MKKGYIETAKFSIGHGLIRGNFNPKLSEKPLEKALSENPPELGEFGLFGGDVDLSRYYPDVTPEDLTPKDDDFIFPIFRALSETVLIKSWSPISFQKPGVLKKSIKLLPGQSVYANHNREVGSELGVILKASWQESYDSKDGVKVPAGINTQLKIDGKSQIKIARGIQMDPPSVHSASVTVTFAWEKSHPEMSDGEFQEKIGTRDAKGNLIMKVVSEIIAYHEISLVPHGADPYAQKINSENQIINPKYAKNFYNLSADDHPGYQWDWKSTINRGIEVISNNSLNHHFNTLNNMDFSELLSQLGFANDKFPSPNELKSFIESLQSTAEKYGKLVSLTSEDPEAFINNLKTKARTEEQESTLTKITEFGGIKVIEGWKENVEAQLNKTRTEAVNLYKSLTPEEKIDENIVRTIENSDMAAAEAFRKTYQAQFEDQSPLTCADCGSKNVSRASFNHAEADEGSLNSPKNDDVVRMNIRKKLSRGTSILHGSEDN